MTTPEIARRLFLSPRTIQTHVSSLLAKLGVPSRAGLIAIGMSLKDEKDARPSRHRAEPAQSHNE